MMTLLQRYLTMIYKQLLIIIYQNENYILIKLLVISFKIFIF